MHPALNGTQLSEVTYDGAGFDFNRNRIAMFLVEEGAVLNIIGTSDRARIGITGGSGSKINVDVDGATINDNKVTSGSGGGIYFYNEINNEKGITISLNINDGYL